MTDAPFIFAEGIPTEPTASPGAGSRGLDLLEAMLSGDCRRCRGSVDRQQAPSQGGRIPFAIIPAATGTPSVAPICEGCAEFLRGAR